MRTAALWMIVASAMAAGCARYQQAGSGGEHPGVKAAPIAGTYAEYREAVEGFREEVTKLRALPGRERLMAGFQMLSTRRDRQALRFTRAVIEVFDKHHVAVANDMRVPTTVIGRPMEIDDVAHAGMAASVMLEGAMAAEGDAAQRLWQDLAVAVVLHCPDRFVRYEVLMRWGLSGAGSGEEKAARERMWREFFASLLSRPLDPSNASVLAAFEIHGATLKELMEGYRRSFSRPTGKDAREAIEALRAAAVAARAMDLSADRQWQINRFINELDERRTEFVGMFGG